VSVRAPLGAFAVAVGIGCVVALSGLSGGPQILVALGALLALAPFVVAALRDRFDIFEPVYLFAASYAVLFVLRPAFELSQPGGPALVVGQDPVPHYAEALVAALLGAAGFYAGYYGGLGRSLARRVGIPHDELAGSSLAVFAVALTLGGLGLYAAFLVQSGGLSALATILAGRSPDSASLMAQPLGYLYTGPLWLGALGVLLLGLAPHWWSRQGAAAVALVVVSQITTATSGSRSWTLPILAAIALLWYLRRGRRPLLALVALMIVPVFVVGVSAPRDYRGTSTRNGSFVDTVLADVGDLPGSVNAFFVGGDTAMLPDLSVEMGYVPSVIPYQMGSSYLEALTRPIPRALWPDKPQAADTRLMEVLWPSFAAANVGFAFSGFGEPYLNFGFAGVLGFGILFGLACRTLYEWFRRAAHNRIVQVLFALSWPFVFVYMRGGLGVDYQRQVILLAPVVVAWLYARRSARAASASEPGVPPSAERKPA
jgi:oligosaccharide repeat unit polymerase